MAPLKEMKKEKLVIMVTDLQLANKGLIDELKAQGVVIVAANEALDTCQARCLELEALVPGKKAPVKEEKCISMVCLTNEVFGPMDRPTRFGYEGIPNEMNDLVVAVPMSRVKAELSREKEPLLTLEDYMDHVQQQQKLEADLESDVDLEDELTVDVKKKK